MGCGQSNKDAQQPQEPNKNAWKEVFPRHPHTGTMTDSAKYMHEMEVEMTKDVPPEAMLLTPENIVEQRAMLGGMMAGIAEANKETIEKNELLCDISDFEIETEPGVMIDIYMIRPKTLPHENNAAYIYAHGGGGCMFSAVMENAGMMKTALNLQCVVFNVEYRLGPEAKAPKGQCDFAAAVRHISKNALKYGVDKNQICMAGISGGGYTCFGAGNQLAKTGDAGLVKAMFLHCSMLSDETQHIPTDKLDRCEGTARFLTSLYGLLATDFDNQQNDTDLYPGRITNDFMKKLPPFAIWTSEFDFYRRDNRKLAERAKACGKLLDISDMPGVMHGYNFQNYGDKEVKWFFEEEKMAFDLWVRCKK